MWVVSVVLGSVANYVYLYFEGKAEARLLREQRKYQSTLRQAAQGMTQVRDLQKLLRLIVHVMTQSVGLAHAEIFLEEPKDNTFQLRAFRYRRQGGADAMRPDDMFIEFLREQRQPVVLDELKAQLGETSLQDSKARRLARAVTQMQHLQASVAVPSFLQDTLVGFLLLGEKRSGKVFTTDDLTVFSALANQAAVAIENARFYDEEKQRQIALFHTASLASLGTMASSMSHQVNNRFNVVSVVSSMQKIKLKELLERRGQDAGALREALEESLAQFTSLEEEAMRGGQVVSAIRTIARPSTGTYKPMPLAAAVRAGLDVVRYKVPFDELDFRCDLPADLPLVSGDQGQLAECVINLVDNANDAIRMKRERAPEWTDKGRIHMRAFADGETVVLEVSDNGLGMTEKEQTQIFVPFFTTKATSEKGTGLGLYVIKKIVEAHQGAIAVQSVAGQGTIFSIRLPALDRAAVAPPGFLTPASPPIGSSGTVPSAN